mgnify:CR=1 FL=1
MKKVTTMKKTFSERDGYYDSDSNDYSDNEDDHSDTEDNSQCILNHEDFDDFLTAPGDPDIMNNGEDDDVLVTENNGIPTTDAGEVYYEIQQKASRGNYINGHVILNQLGSVMDRWHSCITGYASQKHFYRE